MRKISPLKNIIGILFIGLTIGISSCKKENSSIGFDLINPDDKFELFCDTIGIKLYTVEAEKMAISDKTIAPLGSYVDPVFGFLKASTAFQVSLSSSNPNLYEKVNKENFKSLELHLKISSAYGDSLTPQTLYINKLEKDISGDTTDVYSDYEFKPEDFTLLTSGELSYNDADTSNILKFKLPDELAYSFISESNKDYFSSSDNFKTFFKGLYLTTEDLQYGGGIFAIEVFGKQSKLVLNYGDSTSYEFPFNINPTIVLKSFEQDYASASQELKNAINDTLTTQEYAYVQGMAGVKTMIKLPNFTTFFDSENISINRAKLYLTVVNATGEDLFAAPEKICMYVKDESGDLTYIEDVYSNISMFDGDYNSYTYTFNFSIFALTKLKKDEEATIYLAPLYSDYQKYPHRTVFFANPDSEKGPKLELFYTKY